jgi:hypothetical protein
MSGRCDGEQVQGLGLQTDSDIFTQPIARKPIDPRCGGAGDGGSTLTPYELQAEERAARFSYDGDLGSPRPM